MTFWEVVNNNLGIICITGIIISFFVMIAVCVWAENR